MAEADAGDALEARATRLCADTRAKGCEYFDEKADNLTGVLVDLSAHGVREVDGDGDLRPSDILDI